MFAVKYLGIEFVVTCRNSWTLPILSTMIDLGNYTYVKPSYRSLLMILFSITTGQPGWILPYCTGPSSLQIFLLWNAR